MELKVLKDIGLTEGEIRVYMSLIDLGKSTAGKIIEKSKVSPSKIYDVLNRLIGKGLVSYIMEGKVKVFSAAPPSEILNFIGKKEEGLKSSREEFKKLLPNIESRQKAKNEGFSAEIFEGIRGLITVFDMSYEETKKGDVAYAFGYPPYASELFDSYWREYYKKCDEKRIIRKVIYNYETWFLKKRKGRKFTQQRYLPKGVMTPSWFLVFNDKTAIINVTPEQKVCFLIKNKEVAQSYTHYFNLLWKSAIK